MEQLALPFNTVFRVGDRIRWKNTIMARRYYKDWFKSIFENFEDVMIIKDINLKQIGKDLKHGWGNVGIESTSFVLRDCDVRHA